jgi:hypothetical protein
MGLMQKNFVVVGGDRVGKSGLLQRVRKGEWHSASEPTVGADFCQKDMSQLVRLQIWDTGALVTTLSPSPSPSLFPFYAALPDLKRAAGTRQGDLKGTEA